VKEATFSADEKREFRKALKGGMNGTGKDKLPQIQQVAKKLSRDDKDFDLCLCGISVAVMERTTL